MPPSPSGSPTKEEVAEHIWAPWRFSPAVDNASPDGRHVPYLDIKLGDEVVFQLEKVPSGSWMKHCGPEEWWQLVDISSSIKISIYCEKESFEPWTVPRNIPRDGWANIPA